MKDNVSYKELNFILWEYNYSVDIFTVKVSKVKLTSHDADDGHRSN